jgi:hypothetical protein
VLTRRFLVHVLPKGFIRVRDFGFPANRCRARRVAQVRTALAARPPERTPGSEAEAGTEARPCPVCRSGRLRVTWQLAPRGASPPLLHGGPHRRE